MSYRAFKFILLASALLISLILIVPLFNYQPILSVGDHGRDFYCFKKALDGQIVYRDFWWVYGPLMPYYYALFYKVFGIKMSSILIGRSVLILLNEILFFSILSSFTTPVFAFLGTLWFFLFNLDFFFTYNHIGGLVCLLASLYYVLLYLRNDKSKYLYLSLFSIFILSLIKINFGLSVLASFICSVKLIDFTKKNRSKSYLLGLSAMLISIFAIYYLLLSPLPLYEIRQCLPYLSADQPNQSTPWTAIQSFVIGMTRNSVASLPNTFFTALILFSTAFCFKTLLSRTTDHKEKANLFLILTILCIYYVFNIHEYILSGTFYRSFWVKPLSILMVFTVIFWATKHLSFLIRFMLCSALFLNIFLEMINRVVALPQIKVPANFLNLPRAQIFVTNESSWIATVSSTTQFLETHLKKDEPFFALPYDCLYYYLTGRDSPTRQLIFFDHINIPPEQENKIIDELNARKVNWIVLSNRSISVEGGLGKLGVTYCPLIGKFIGDNFEVVTQFGEWTDADSWGWNHAVRILRRTAPLH